MLFGGLYLVSCLPSSVDFFPETYTHRILQMYYVWSLLLFIRHGIQIHQRSVLYYERRIFWELVLGDSLKIAAAF